MNVFHSGEAAAFCIYYWQYLNIIACWKENNKECFVGEKMKSKKNLCELIKIVQTMQVQIDIANEIKYNE